MPTFFPGQRWAVSKPTGNGLGGYSPTLRRQITTAENEGPDSAAYAAVAWRGNILSALIILIVVGIVYLMAVKPPL